MTKREEIRRLKARIEALEQRIIALEARPHYWPVSIPSPLSPWLVPTTGALPWTEITYGICAQLKGE